MPVSIRQLAYGAAVLGLLALFAATDDWSRSRLATAAPATSPLDRVPADSALFVHLRADQLWDHPAVLSLRKQYAKQLATTLKEVTDVVGIQPDDVETLTFHYPKFPAGPGDETLFVFQIVTKKPYDKDTILKGVRPKGVMPKGDVIALEGNGKLMLHLTSDRQFTVVHESLLKDFTKAAAKDGPLAEAIKVARDEKSTAVFGLEPSGLPNEIFTAPPPELQPFIPLLKSKSIMVRATVGNELKFEAKFLGENEEKAIENERAFNLLMKLATDGLSELLNMKEPDEDLKAFLPTVKELHKATSSTQAKRDGNNITASAGIKADADMLKPIAETVLKIRKASARTISSNNLKQIALALHNYHSVIGSLPPAAIVDKKGKPLLSWRVAILPYIEQDNLYRQFKMDEAWDSPHNLPLSKTRIKVFELPYLEDSKGETNYRVFVGGGAAFDMIQGFKFQDFKDGTSNTMMVFESTESTPWSKPDDIEFDPKKPLKKFFRFENGRCNIAMGDGSVRAISDKIDDKILKLIIQKDDGEVVPELP